MATYNKFDCFVFDLGAGQHDLANDQLYLYLTNATPSNNDDNIKSELAEITAANGYNNTNTCDCNWTQATNISTLKANNDVTWTAAAGNFGPFRYVVLCNANATPDDLANCCLISWWDYGSSINCNNGESFTVDFPANKVVFTIT